VVDLGKNIGDSSRGSEVFGSIVSGLAFPQDKLLILTKDIYEALRKDQAFSDLGVLAQEKQFREFLQKKNKILSRLSGILFVFLAEEFVSQASRLSFLRKHMFSFRLPKLRFSFSQFLRLQIPAFKQKIMLIGVLVIVVLGGFLLFQGERKELAKRVQTVVLQIQVIQKEAQDALELSDQRSANILLQEAWKKASSHTGSKEPSREIFIALQKELEQQLFSINSIEYIKEPSVFLDMGQESVNLIPQEMMLVRGNLYLFNPFSPDIFIFNVKEKKREVVSAARNIRYGIPFAGSPLFFGEPDLLFSMTPGGLDERTLKDASSFAGMAGFDNGGPAGPYSANL